MNNLADLNNYAVGKTFYATLLQNGEKKRCVREDDGYVFAFAKRSRKYGRRYDDATFLQQFRLPATIPQTYEWHKRLKRAIRCLESSGLWPNIKEVFQNCLYMTWEDHEKMREIYWSRTEWKNKEYKQKTDEEMNALWEPFVKMYPFAFYTVQGNTYIHDDYISDWVKCQLKAMYFGKEQNEYVKGELKKAIAEKRSWSQNRIQVSYDVSVEYNAEKQRAYYSEEYRRCGNGHYYLALDHSTAMFYEDD